MAAFGVSWGSANDPKATFIANEVVLENRLHDALDSASFGPSVVGRFRVYIQNMLRGQINVVWSND
ncbi:MAG: hypothetical protein WBN61_02120, partial [Woeseiaceae bacterium]